MMHWYNGTHHHTTKQDHFYRLTASFMEFFEEMTKSPGSVLEGPGCACDLTDADLQRTGNRTLLLPFQKRTDNLPPFGKRFAFLRGQDILQQHLRFFCIS